MAFLSYVQISTLLFFDIATKHFAKQIFAGRLLLIPGFLRLEVVYNRNSWFGSAFASTGQSSGVPLSSLATALALLAFFFLLHRANSTRRRCAFAFLSAGAAGNLLSWLLDGAVVDFIALPLLPIFNLADLWLVIGVSMLLFDLYGPSREKPDVPHPL